MHTLFNCASWVGHQSTIWSLGGIKPSCNTPQGHNTSYTQPAPLAHTAIPLIQLFLIFKTQTHHSYFFNFLTLRVAHPQGDRTRVAHPSPVWLSIKMLKQQTVDKQTNTQPDQDANVPKWHFSKPTHWAFRKPLTLPTMSSIPLVVSAAPLSLPPNAP